MGSRARGGERELWARLLAGDEEAFRSLVREHHRVLMRVAMTLVGNRALAEEVVQETWQAVVGGLARFEGRSSLRTWIFHILVKRARTRGPREARYVPFSALDSIDEAGDDAPIAGSAIHRRAPHLRIEENSPERLLLRLEISNLLESAIDALPPTLRAVLSLRDVAGMSSVEVCETLGMSEANQRVTLHRARVRLRRALQAYLSEEEPE